MGRKLFAAVVSALALTFASCLHADSSHENSSRVWVRVTKGKAVLNITRVARGETDQFRVSEPGEERRPMPPAGTIIGKETVRLSAGREHAFRVMSSETAIVNIMSADGDDLEFTSRDTRGRERAHSVSGQNRLGITIAF